MAPLPVDDRALRSWNEEYLRTSMARLALTAALAWERQSFVSSTFSLGDWQIRLDELLDELSDTAPPRTASERRHSLHQALLIQETRCEELRRRYADVGAQLPIDRLVEAFDLTRFEEQVIELALGHAADSRLGWIVAAFRGHHELSLPTVSLALSLFAEPKRRVECLQTFLPAARLRSQGLLLLGQPSPGGRSLFVPFQERPFHLPDWLLTFLLGEHDFLAGQEGVRFAEAPEGSLDDLVLEPDVAQRVEEELLPLLPPLGSDLPAQVASRFGSHAPLIQLTGPAGSSRKTIARTLCGQRGLGLGVVDSTLLGLEEEPDAEGLALVCAAARLKGAGLLFTDLDAVWKKAVDADRSLAWLLERLTAFPGPVFLLSERAAPITPHEARRPVASCACAVPSFTTRAELWRKWLPEPLRPSDEVIERLARRFLLSPGQQRRVAQDAVAARRDAAVEAEAQAIPEDELFERCERSQHTSLKVFGEIIRSHLTWKDLVLDDELVERFDEIRLYARYRMLVFSEWGFGRRYPKGQGLSVLMSGPPGTGKTMAAELLAQELRKPLFRADISRLVDKYIGETEKQLGKLFDTAEASDTILLFDEADSLFGKRVSVKSSTDRYSNLSVNFLLQRIEAYPGVVLLTTNHAESIDPAFRRRLTFIVEFREPDEDERAAIWENSMPDEAPIDEDVDWLALGEDFELTGGHIKNAALRAALRAAKAGSDITMDMLCREANRELEVRGRLVRD